MPVDARVLGVVASTIAAVCPIRGVSLVNGAVVIDFAPDATAQQRADAFAALLAYRSRRKRSIQAIASDIAALGGADRNRLALAIQAAYLRDNPGFARALSIALDGDEEEEN